LNGSQGLRSARMSQSIVIPAIVGTVCTCAIAGAQQETTRDRLQGWIDALPTLRAALVEPARRNGLHDAEAMIVRWLKEMGYAPALEPIAWKPSDLRSVPDGKAPVVSRSDDGGMKVRLVDDPHPDQWNNIIVELPGKTHPDEVVIVGAHYDAVPTTPGADDNASGVAGALEIARALAHMHLDRTVRIVFFNLEEVGLNGSRQHAKAVKARIDAGKERVVGMLSLEMIGYYTDAPNSQRLPFPEIPGVFENPPTVGDFLAIVANQGSASLAHEVADAIHDASPALKTFVIDFIPGTGFTMPDTRRSDHAPYWDRNIASLLITDTSEFRTPNYHKPSDTRTTLDLRRMTLAVDGLVAAVKRLATTGQ